MRPELYLDAVRHMHARQLVFRLRRVLPPGLLATGLPTATAPVPKWLASGLGGDPAPQSGPTPAPHEERAVTAFGIRRSVEAADFWRDSRDGLLFLFHLHGFSDLARYALGPRSPDGDAFWVRLIDDWLRRECTPSNPAWHPYPTSDRIIAWTAALSSIGAWPEAFRHRLTTELWRQTAYLRRCIEYDIGGNHVLRNATALTFAGSVFPSSDVLEHGLALLERETASQFLQDGAHEERSSSYHRRAHHDLGEVMELLARLARPAPEWLSDVVARAGRWQADLAGPDGHLPLLNDAWEGPPLLSRRRGADTGSGRARERVSGPGEAGYLIMRSGNDQVLFDLGRLCPAHLPAHAHADALSFVLWLDGRPLIVDPGSYRYEGPFRDRLRATAAHNSVEVDGHDQCVLWGNFRASHLPRVWHVAPSRHGESVVVAGAHDGYRRLPDRVEHHRALAWVPAAGLVAIDRLAARAPHQIRSSLHLAPGVEITDAGQIENFTVVALGEGAAVRREEGIYSPYLGTKSSAAVLVDRRVVGPGHLFGWSVLRAGWRVTFLSRARLELEHPDRTPIVIPLQWAEP